MIRLLPGAIELAGYAAIVATLYLVNPILLVGAGGLVLIGVGIALQRALEKPNDANQ